MFLQSNSKIDPELFMFISCSDSIKNKYLCTQEYMQIKEEYI